MNQARDELDLALPLDLDDPPQEVDAAILALARTQAMENELASRLKAALAQGEDGTFGPILRAMDEEPPASVDRAISERAHGDNVRPLFPRLLKVGGFTAVAASLLVATLVFRGGDDGAGPTMDVAKAPMASGSDLDLGNEDKEVSELAQPSGRVQRELQRRKVGEKVAKGARRRSADRGGEATGGFGNKADAKLSALGEEGVGDSAKAAGLHPSELPASEIRRVVQQHRKGLVKCVTVKPKRTLKIEIRVKVQPDGRTKVLKIGNRDQLDAKMAACLEEEIGGWRFPSFSGPAQEMIIPVVLASDY